MSPRKKQAAGLSAVLALVSLIVGGALLLGGSPQAELAAASPEHDFSFESSAVLERLQQLGRPVVRVHIESREDLIALEECFSTPEVRAQMEAFCGVLVDRADDPGLRDAKRTHFVVRSPNGAVLALLVAPFDCKDVAALLARVRRLPAARPRPSPLYQLAGMEPEVIDRMVEAGDGARAARIVALLEEAEGVDSDAARAARARLEAVR